MDDDTRAEAAWPAPYAGVEGGDLYAWYVTRPGQGRTFIGVYSHDVDGTDDGPIRSIRISRRTQTQFFTDRVTVDFLKAYTKLADSLDDLAGSVLPG